MTFCSLTSFPLTELTMKSLFIWTLCLIFYSIIDKGESVKCYSCFSVLNDNCGTKFNSTGIETVDAEYCLEITQNIHDVNHVIRSGGTWSQSMGCTTASVAGSSIETCACNTDLCNSGNVNFGDIGRALFFSLAVVASRFFF